VQNTAFNADIIFINFSPCIFVSNKKLKINFTDDLIQEEQMLDKVWMVPLYWHYWEIESEFYKKFNKDIIQLVTKRLKSI